MDDPAHLLTDLCIDGRFLQSKANPSNEPFFSESKKLRTLMKLHQTRGEEGIPLEVEDLEYVPNLLDTIQHAIAQVYDMSDKNSKKSAFKLKNTFEQTFNSLVFIYPIIKNILDHPKKEDLSLVMKNGPVIQKKKNDLECYIIGDYVYSIVKTKRLKAIRNSLRSIELTIDPFVLRVFGQRDYSRLSDILPTMCDALAPEKTCILQKSLRFPLDSITEAFGHQFDLQIIKPLAQDRTSKQKDFEKSIDKLNFALSDLLSEQFKGHLDIYGSCLSGLALGNSSDVDISLHDHSYAKYQIDYQKGKISEESFKRKTKGIVFRLFHLLQSQSRSTFSDIEAIAHARVPVVKGRYLNADNPFTKDGSLDFDICFLNRIAVVNSNLIKEYSKIDPRVRSLMLAVKAWVKTTNLGSAADGTLSSYTWMIIVIFYLQILGVVPNLQSNDLIEKCQSKFDQNTGFHVVNGFITHHVTCNMLRKSQAWCMPEKFQSTPTSYFLLGFFSFYAKIFPWESTAVSIRLGNMTLKKTVFKSARLWRMAIEDPFETHSSHMPHDLGRPITKTTQPKIHAELLKIANQLEQLFTTRDGIVDCIGSMNYVENRSSTLSATLPDSVNQTKPQKRRKKKPKTKRRITSANMPQKSRENPN